MRMLLIDAGAGDESRLCEVLARGGFDVDVGHFESESEHVVPLLSEAGAPHSLGAAWLARPEPRRARALLFEALDQTELASAILGAVRSDAHFDDVAALISLTIESADWFERVRGFDDFVLHPWSPAELLGRVQAVQARRADLGPEALIQVGGVWMDTSAREALIDGRPVHLTAREFALLVHLCGRRGRVLSREHLLQHVWGKGYRGGARTVDVHIRRLRSKLGPALRIDTVRSGGYRLCRDTRHRALPLARTERGAATAGPLGLGGFAMASIGGLPAADGAHGLAEHGTSAFVP